MTATSNPLLPTKTRVLPLPDAAQRFLRDLAVTHKKNTVNGYTSTLNAFHTWLENNRISLTEINREQITTWFSELAVAGKSPSCRAARTIHLRMYFLWLSEEGRLSEHPFSLVRTKDIPRLPQYLPKPLPREVDIALTARLEQSQNLCRMGLLLMRKTGIRIGELRTLAQHCITSDSNNRHFLKVPLGKLNNERLVPLDQSTLLLVRKLQHRNDGPDKQFLLEDNRQVIPSFHSLSRALQHAARGLELDAKITSHRLRHTFATSLLNAGMSILALMKILGHRSYRMTLRYAALTQETVANDYFRALDQIRAKYHTPQTIPSTPDIDPVKLLSLIIRMLDSDAKKHPAQHQTAARLIKRIYRLQSDLEAWTASF